MSVSFELPTELESQLRSGVADFDNVAKEAALVEFYRQDILSRHEN